MAPFPSPTSDRSGRRPTSAATAWWLAATVLAGMFLGNASPGMAQSAEDETGDDDDLPRATATVGATAPGNTAVTSPGLTTQALGDAASASVPGPDGETVTLENESADTGRVPLDQDLARTNLREGSVDGLKVALDTGYDVPGIPLGTFTLKPSLGQTFNHETTRNGSERESRSYVETGLKGTLTSDWSRHQLSVTGEGYWQRNLSGTGETEPRASIDAALRLDVSHDTTATLRAGYSFDREDATDPNAVADARTQSGVNQYTLGADIDHDFGILRGSAKVDFDRITYSDVELSDGTTLIQKDRNRKVGTLTTRIGYELSPALVPFLEASIGRGVYDLRTDSRGYARSYDTYSGRAGVEVDLGEKLKGEIGLGYSTYRFDDPRLRALNGATVEGLINWSPQRGTDVAYGLSTTLEPSTTSGESGALAYTLSNRITHELRSALVARLSNSLTLRNYPSGSASRDEKVWQAGAGLTYDINRYLALTGDVSYERTMPDTGTATSVARVGVGLTLRR